MMSSTYDTDIRRVLGGGQEEGGDGCGPVPGLAGFEGFVRSLADYTGEKRRSSSMDLT